MDMVDYECLDLIEGHIGLTGGQCVKKLMIYVWTTTILYGGITFNFLTFFTCYHYVIFYFGLIEKGLALLIISNPIIL